MMHGRFIIQQRKDSSLTRNLFVDQEENAPQEIKTLQ
jgi:hypothetical protein